MSSRSGSQRWLLQMLMPACRREATAAVPQRIVAPGETFVADVQQRVHALRSARTRRCDVDVLDVTPLMCFCCVECSPPCGGDRCFESSNPRIRQVGIMSSWISWARRSRTRRGCDVQLDDLVPFVLHASPRRAPGRHVVADVASSRTCAELRPAPRLRPWGPGVSAIRGATRSFRSTLIAVVFVSLF